MSCSGKQESNDREPLVMNSTPNLTKKKVISIAIFELVIQFTFFLFFLNFLVFSVTIAEYVIENITKLFI